MGCVAAKPIVDGIERKHTGKLLVIRLDVQDTAGGDLAGTQRIRHTHLHFLRTIRVKSSGATWDASTLPRSLIPEITSFIFPFIENYRLAISIPGL
jgi:hypothetical protein